jgi:ferritin-like metal-binding protein YciE
MLGPSEREVESTMTDQLLVHGLQKMYHAEQELHDALGTLAEQTEDETARKAFSEHREETREHIERLEQVFEALGVDAQTREEKIVGALIDEHEAFARDNDGEVLDRYNLEVTQKTEHYEIAAYGSLTSLAEKTGHDEAADLLSQTLDEEKQALDEVTEASEQFDQQQAAGD